MTEKTKLEIDVDLQHLIPQFIENRKNDVLSLVHLAEKKDLTSIAQLAHKIKGAAAGYGFSRLSSMAAEIEQSTKNNDLSAITRITNDMKMHLENIEIHFVIM